MRKTFSFSTICAIIKLAMRSKHIAALITFFATFAFSAFIALLFAAPKVYEVPPVVNSYEVKTYKHKRCGTGYKIREFLDQDKRNGIGRLQYNFTGDDEFFTRSTVSAFADSVAEYASESGAMDDSGFPRDFQIAWRAHMKAWSDYAEFLQKSKNKRMTFDDFDTLADEYSQEITDTWQETLRIGREHGANIPAGF